MAKPAKMFLLCGLLFSCATYNVQKGKTINEIPASGSTSETDFQLILVGDAGNAEEAQAQYTLNAVKNKLDSAGKNSMLIFLGDNIYPLGMPKESDKEYHLAKQKMENQLTITKNFKGKTLVIPGNHDWYHGLEGLKAQENFVNAYLNDKKAFLPKNSCPIDDISLTKDIKLIVIDSEWALINWDKNPGINKGCDIQTREDLYDEFKDLIIKNQGKRIIVALHHPIISSGVHAGFNSAKSHLSAFHGRVPVPILATALNSLRSVSGASMEDLNNQHYTDFANRIKSIVQDNENVIFVSGHDHNLQYHEERYIKQIVSGAGSKTDPATIISKKDFSFGGSGFAVLNLRKDQSADVTYFSTKNNQISKLSQIAVLSKPIEFNNDYPSQLATNQTSTIYSDELTKKSSFYRWLWGDHYRKYYALPISAQVADLSKLNGGYTPFREGGGNQSNSLRLMATNEQEFVMRGVKKSAVRFLNAQAFKKSTFGHELYNTFPDRFLLDFYTTSHPFANLVVNPMAEKINLFHSNPQLYFVPKQKTLGEYNRSFGDEMYLIEERFSADPTTLKSLDNADDIVSTDDVLKNLKKDNTKYEVDKDLYLRARIFDMIIGDWDRHDDQWKWAAYKKDGKVIYKPIPKDRDQAFSNYDGTAFKIVMNIPMIRHMKSFKEEIKNVRWVNMEPYPLDLIFLKATSEKDWALQVKYIQTHLTDEDIDEAFRNLPNEVQDDTARDIQRKVKIRKKNIEKYALEYYDILQEKVPLVGTKDEDKFVIIKNENSIDVKQYKIAKDKSETLVFEKTYNGNKTKELWIYGLDDDDKYEVTGNGKSKTKIRLIGGYNHDVYSVSNGKNVKIYDFKSQKNTYETKGARKHISDDYEINTYQWKHPKYNFFAGYPMANYNPDDGIILGFVANYTVNNFIRDRFTQKHSISTNLYTATGGFNLGYKGIFKKAIFRWDAQLDAMYTTPHFARTFFGLGNESKNDADEDNRDYNRVRINQFKVAPSISTTSWLNIKHQFQLTFETSKVQKNEDRFVAVSPEVNPSVFQNQEFAGANYTFSFKNLDNKAFPTLGMEMILNAGWKTNLAEFKRNFATFSGTMNIFRKIDKKGKFVFANSANAMIINNNNFEFYQAAAIGGNNAMRAYRNERFAGKSYFVNNSEIRWDFGRVKNNIVPVNMGILVGYDVGRVWMDNEQSNQWHQGVGGGFWMNILETFSARVDYFTGEDGGRISGGFGLSF